MWSLEYYYCQRPVMWSSEFGGCHFFPVVIAESKGGDTNIANLRPVCAACNLSMGVMSMNEFTTKFFGWSV